MAQEFSDRLRKILTERNISRRKLASLVNVTRPTVSAWTSGTAKPYPRTIRLLCEKLAVSREWLLFGKGQPHSYSELSEDQRAFAAYLAKGIEVGDAELLPDVSDVVYAEYLSEAEQLADNYAALVERYQSLAQAGQMIATEAGDAIRNLKIEHDRKLNDLAKRKAKQRGKKDLHSKGKPLERESMTAPSLAELLTRVRQATEAKGEKKKLAAMLNVAPQQLSDWLSGNYSPGGAVTLQLLAWVQANEAKQKRHPEGAQTPPGLKTQRRSSKHETNTSGQKKSSHKRPARSTLSRRSPAKKR